MASENIFQSYLQPVKSVSDYSSDLDKMEQNKLTLASARLANQQAQQSMADDQSARQASIASGGDTNKMIQALNASGNYKQAQAIQKQLFDSQKTQAETNQANAHAKNFDANTEKTAQETKYAAAVHHAQGLAYVQTPQDIATYIDQGIAKGVFPPDSKGPMLQRAASFASVDDWKKASEQESIPVLEKFKVDAENSRNAATNQTSRDNNTATVGATIRGQNLVDARKRDELQGAESAFTPDAIKNAASRYNIDGTLPPMGMGKSGSAGRAAILNEAAVQAGQNGLSGDDQRIAQIGNKANSAALSKLQQSQSMVGAFEKNFNKNADLALELSAKVDNTGVPIVNKWLNAGKRSVTGDPALAQYDVAVKSTLNEYAKIISGSMGNTATAQGEVAKVEKLLNSAQTPEQVVAVVNFMKKETANRMAGFEEEKASLRGSMGRGNKTTTPPNTAKTVNFGDLK